MNLKSIISIGLLFCFMACDGNEPTPNNGKTSIDTTLDYRKPSAENQAYQTFLKPVNAEVGDAMPYYNEADQMFYVYFLISKFSGYPRGGIYLSKTQDFARYYPVSSEILVGESNEKDSGIGTGSCIKKDNTYHFFYTGFNSSATPSVVKKATTTSLSANWLKSPMEFGAPENFERGEFRDPHVYWDDTRNKYLMLVGSRSNGKASIARFQSDDLNDWQSIEAIAATTSDNPKEFEIETDSWIPECPDLFKIGNKWYMVFSRLNRDEHRKTFYRIADNPNGPWRKCSDEQGHHETFDGLFFYAGKTVSDGTNHYVSGWASSGQERQPHNGELSWGGILVTHKLIQQANGKLYPTIPDAVDQKFSKAMEFKDIKRSGTVSGEGNNFNISNGGKIVFNRNISSVKITMQIDAQHAEKGFGIAFGAHDKQEDTYKLTFDTGSQNHYGTPALFMHHNDKELNFTPLIVPQNKQFDLKIIIERQVCVMYVNNQVAFTNRISNMEQNPWMIFADEGSIQVSNIEIKKTP